ncbi:MAG: hypothetical protein LUD02_04125 [Tannerellaceae bacterium]|nr:hypothetical protein [Tannerellaceae bacterium]MCD8263434.1 hypothetical protein [Tannerellaceae bacterium]
MEITNGRPPFTLELLDTDNNVLQTETAYTNDDFYFTGLSNGDYWVRITDACDGSQIVTTNVFSLDAPAADLPSFNDINTAQFDYTMAYGNTVICGQLSLYYNLYQNASTENVIIGDAETATTYYQYIQMSWVYDAGGEDEQSGTYGYMTNQTVITIQNFDPSKTLTVSLIHPCDSSVLTIDATLPDESTVYVTDEFYILKMVVR